MTKTKGTDSSVPQAAAPSPFSSLSGRESWAGEPVVAGIKTNGLANRGPVLLLRHKHSKMLRRETDLKIKVVVHEAEEGGFWAEVPVRPRATHGTS